jgi:hypothetical protein
MTETEQTLWLATHDDEKNHYDSAACWYVAGDYDFSRDDANQFLKDHYPELFKLLYFDEFDPGVAETLAARKAAIYRIR